MAREYVRHTNTNELNVLGVAEYLFNLSKGDCTKMRASELIKLYQEIIDSHEQQKADGIRFSEQREREIASYKARVLELQQEPE